MTYSADVAWQKNPERHVVILGSRSEIYQSMRQMMLNDGWALWEWNKGDLWGAPQWDARYQEWCRVKSVTSD